MTIAKSLLYNRLRGKIDLFATLKTWGKLVLTNSSEFMMQANGLY